MASSSRVNTPVYTAVRVKRNPREICLRSATGCPVLMLSCARSGFEGGFGIRLRRRTFLRRFDHISDPADGVDQLLRILVVDLAAQVPDVHVHDIGQPVVIHVPDMLYDHGAAEG